MKFMQLLRNSVIQGFWFQPLTFRCRNLINYTFLKKMSTTDTPNDNTYLYRFYFMNFFAHSYNKNWLFMIA